MSNSEQDLLLGTKEDKKIFRARHPWFGNKLLGFAFLLETVCLVAHMVLFNFGHQKVFAWYHILAGARSVVWIWAGYVQIKAVGLDLGEMVSFFFAVDTLFTMGLLVMTAGAIVDGASFYKDPCPLFLISIPVQILAIYSENFLFRVAATTFHFTKTEYKVMKIILIAGCCYIMAAGVLALARGHRRKEQTLFVLTLLVWRREMVASLSRLDGSNKFSGLLHDYKLDNHPWYEGKDKMVIPRNAPETLDPVPGSADESGSIKKECQGSAEESPTDQTASQDLEQSAIDQTASQDLEQIATQD